MTLRPGESFTIHSIESFLSDAEIRQILRPIDRLKKARGPRAFVAGEQDGSVHHLGVFGLTGKQAARVFSPRGRIEIPRGTELPELRDRLDETHQDMGPPPHVHHRAEGRPEERGRPPVREQHRHLCPRSGPSVRSVRWV